MNQWTRVLSESGKLMGVELQVGALASDMILAHGLEDQQAKGLIEATIAGLLLASYCKKGERINLQIKGQGYYQEAIVDARPNGSVRGYVKERSSEKVSLTDEEGRSFGPWGPGVMQVLRSKASASKPFIGTVPLVTGHLAKDLAFYWFQSEQVRSAVGIFVEVKGKEVRLASGFLLQALPGASEQEARELEGKVGFVEKMGDSSIGEESLQLLPQLLSHSPFTVLEKKDLFFHCDCDMERVQSAVGLLSDAEIAEYLEQGESVSIRCDFCASEYEVSQSELKKLLGKRAKP